MCHLVNRIAGRLWVGFHSWYKRAVQLGGQFDLNQSERLKVVFKQRLAGLHCEGNHWRCGEWEHSIPRPIIPIITSDDNDDAVVAAAVNAVRMIHYIVIMNYLPLQTADLLNAACTTTNLWRHSGSFASKRQPWTLLRLLKLRLFYCQHAHLIAGSKRCFFPISEMQEIYPHAAESLSRS